jgi:protein TonB
VRDASLLRDDGTRLPENTLNQREERSMFENYVGAKTRKRRKWVTVLIILSVTLHVIGAVALIVKGFWTIAKLTPPKQELALAVAPPPPPPPPPPKASKKKKSDKKVVKKIKPQGTRQPVDKKDDDPDIEIEVVDLNEGVEGGVEGGVAGGVVGGLIGGSLEGLPGGVINKPPPPPPPPAKPQIVPQVAVEQKRIAGEKQIEPDDGTKMQMQRDGQNQVVASVKMCLAANGNVSSLNMLKSSGYPAYDRKISGKMRQWRYQPFIVNGKAVPVCTSVTFIYRQAG